MGVGNISDVFLWFFALITLGLVLVTGAMIALGLRFAGLSWRRCAAIGLIVPTLGALAAWITLWSGAGQLPAATAVEMPSAPR